MLHGDIRTSYFTIIPGWLPQGTPQKDLPLACGDASSYRQQLWDTISKNRWRGKLQHGKGRLSSVHSHFTGHSYSHQNQIWHFILLHLSTSLFTPLHYFNTMKHAASSAHLYTSLNQHQLAGINVWCHVLEPWSWREMSSATTAAWMLSPDHPFPFFFSFLLLLPHNPPPPFSSMLLHASCTLALSCGHAYMFGII